MEKFYFKEIREEEYSMVIAGGIKPQIIAGGKIPFREIRKDEYMEKFYIREMNEEGYSMENDILEIEEDEYSMVR